MNNRTTVRRITPQDAEYWTPAMDGPVVAKREITYQSSAYVPALPEHRQSLPAQSHNAMVLDVTPTTTANVDVRTSHKDRAIGFSIGISQLSAIIALAIIVIRPWWSNASFLEYATLVYFVSIYAACWLIGYVLSNIVLTPEFTMLFEARGKLKLLEREQKERWRYYNGK